MCFLVCQGRDGVRLGGGQVNSLEKVYLVEWGIDGNYIWCVFIVVIFMGLGGGKMLRRCFKFISLGGMSQSGDQFLRGEWGSDYIRLIF